MPAIHYWLSGASLFLAGSFILTIIVGLIAIRDLISNKFIVVLVIAALILMGIGWWSTAKQENASAELVDNIKQIVGVAQSEQSLSVLIGALRDSQQQVAGHEQSQEIIRRILAQYDQLQAATSTFEKFTGTPNVKDRLATAEHIIDELKVQLGNIQYRQIVQGQGPALIIKTAPNTFRITFPVPMRIAPDIQFGSLPPGVTANVIEKSNIGFTVVFSPLSIPIDHIP